MTPLLEAIQNDDLETVQALLAAQPDSIHDTNLVSFEQSTNQPSHPSVCSPVTVCGMFSVIALSDLLLFLIIQPKTRLGLDPQRHTELDALDIGMLCSSPAVIRVLLEAGAIPKADQDGVCHIGSQQD